MPRIDLTDLPRYIDLDNPELNDYLFRIWEILNQLRQTDQADNLVNPVVVGLVSGTRPSNDVGEDGQIFLSDDGRIWRKENGDWGTAVDLGGTATPGLDGDDGVGLEWVFVALAAGQTPAAPDNAWTYGTGGVVTVGSTTTEWHPTPPGLSQSVPVLWQAVRRISGTDPETDWTAPGVASRFALDGGPGPRGPTGNSFETAWLAGTQAEPTAPDNAWGYGERSGAWQVDQPDLTATTPYLWEARREVEAGVMTGDDVPNQWSGPVIAAHFGLDGLPGDRGDPGRDGTALEYAYARTTSEDIRPPAPDNAWGFDESGYVGWSRDGYERVFVEDQGLLGATPTPAAPSNAWTYGNPGTTTSTFQNTDGSTGTRTYEWLVTPPTAVLPDALRPVWYVERAVPDGVADGDVVADQWSAPALLPEHTADTARWRSTRTIGTSASPRIHWEATRRVPAGADPGDDVDGEWSEPYVNSGPPGQDGVGLEFIFARTAEGANPPAPSNTWGFDQPEAPWTDDAPGLTAAEPVLWQTERRIDGAPDEGDAVGWLWRTPHVVGRFGDDGRPGDRGDPGAPSIGIEFVYAATAAAVTPTAPSNLWGYAEPQGQWSSEIPGVSVAVPLLWVSTRQVIGQPEDGDDVVAPWSEARILSRVGPPGQDGDDAAGTEFIFARTALEDQPPAPSNAWGFDQPEDPWTDAAPGLTPDEPVLWQAQRRITGQPADGAAVAAEWSDPRVIGRIGDPGAIGRPGAGIEYVFTRTVTEEAPAAPDNAWGFDQPGTIIHPLPDGVQRMFAGTADADTPPPGPPNAVPFGFNAAVGSGDTAVQWWTDVANVAAGLPVIWVADRDVPDGVALGDQVADEWSAPFLRPTTTWTDAAPGLTALIPYLWQASRPVQGVPEVGDAVEGAWTDPVVVGRWGDEGLPGPSGRDGADAERWYPFVYGLRYNNRNSTSAASTTGGAWVARVQAGQAFAGTIDWDQIRQFEFSRRDADGNDRTALFRAVDWTTPGKLIAIAEEIPPDGPVSSTNLPERRVVSFMTTGQFIEENNTFRIGVSRITDTEVRDAFDRGTPAELAPGITDDYDLYLLLPHLLRSLTFDETEIRMPLWVQVEVTDAQTLAALRADEAAAWPASVNQLVATGFPGRLRAGDVVTLYGAEYSQTRAYNTATSVWDILTAQVPGTLLATGGIITPQIAAGAITAEKIDAGAVTAEKIDAAAVNTDKIAGGAVTGSHIAVDAILQSTDYSEDASGDPTAGWQITRAGEAHFSAASIYGTLSADNIDSNVQNWVQLWNENRREVTRDNPIDINEDISDFEFLVLVAAPDRGPGFTERWGIWGGPLSETLHNPGDEIFDRIFVGGGIGPGETGLMEVETRDNGFRIRATTNQLEIWLKEVWGVRSPSMS